MLFKFDLPVLFKSPFTPSVNVNAAVTVSTYLSLKSMEKIESLQNGVATHFGAIPLISTGAMSQVSPLGVNGPKE